MDVVAFVSTDMRDDESNRAPVPTPLGSRKVQGREDAIRDGQSEQARNEYN